jgi:hypothetical protein
MIEIPLSQIGSAKAFAAEVESHRAALLAHQASVEKPIPLASAWAESVIDRRPQTGPVAERGPDDFVVLPYTVIDDTPRTPEQERAMAVLRETVR